MSDRSDSLRAFAHRFVAAHNNHDAAAVGQLHGPHGSLREAASGNERHGQDQIASGLAGFLVAFPDASWNATSIVVVGGRALVPYRLTGTLSQRLGPFEPKGQALELDGVFVLDRGDDGRLTTIDYWDPELFTRQMRSDADRR